MYQPQHVSLIFRIEGPANMTRPEVLESFFLLQTTKIKFLYSSLFCLSRSRIQLTCTVKLGVVLYLL